MYKNIIIIGKGSAGKKHYKILKSISKNIKIIIYSSRYFYKTFKSRKKIESQKINPSYVVLASPSSTHYNFIKLFEKIFGGIDILIEKPLYHTLEKKIKNLKNNYFVAFNLRYHPVILFLKRYLALKKFYFVRIICSSNLIDWRKTNKYFNSVSSIKKLGGGALLELSHELDYTNWIFGNIRPINIFNKKISNLNINTDDILLVHAKLGKKTILNLDINFFSKKNIRKIFIDSDLFSIEADLIKNEIIILKNNKFKKIKFKSFKIIKTYSLMHKDIFENRKYICKFTEGLAVQKIIHLIQNS